MKGEMAKIITKFSEAGILSFEPDLDSKEFENLQKELILEKNLSSRSSISSTQSPAIITAKKDSLKLNTSEELRGTADY